MIQIIKLSKCFNKQPLFKDFSFAFPKNGLIAICGPSGCGKSTLLNMLSGLIKPDEGKIYHDKVDLYSLNDDELSIYRLKNFGFVFQDFKLFETETVFNNIALPLDSLTKTNKRIKNRKIEDFLSLVNLNQKIDQNVNLLSGGEKQCIAIARAIINNPKVIFADEPTGALDENNAIEIMKILKIISSTSLVVVVSHDVNLIKQYANTIIYMVDGKITNVEELSLIPDKKENLPIVLERKKIKKASIPLPFLIHHSYKKMKEKKWRMMLCDMVMSLSLIGVGASISLTSSISTNIKKAYSDMLGENRICVERKNEPIKNYGIYSTSREEVEEIANEMNEYVDDIGVDYYIDYEHFFTNFEQITFSKENENSFYVGGLSFRDINDYIWLDDLDLDFVYPSPVRYLNEDEVILGLDIDLIREICFGIKIERTVNSLSNYLNSHSLYMNLEVENYDWGFASTLSFKVKGFLLEKESKIYHSMHNWNEIVYEQMLGFPPANYISGFSKYPWDLRKIYYLKTKGGSEDFLVNVFNKIEFGEYIFEVASNVYYPNLYKNYEYGEIDRLLVFKDYRNGINTNLSPYIINHCKGLSNPVYATYGGYSIYPSAFMSGFSKPTYFSSSLDDLDDAVDTLSSLHDDITNIDGLPQGVISGYFANSNFDNISFSPIDDVNLTSKLKLNEVIISSGLAKALFNDANPINKEIYLTFNNKDIPLSNNKVKREFVNTILMVKGISDEKKYIIHQRSDWSVLFFQCKLGVSIFSLSPYLISYEINSKSDSASMIERGNKYFKELEFYDPMEDFNLGVDEICNYVQIALVIFSLLSIVVSILLLSTCSYLHILENKKDIGLARCLGLPKKEASKFIFTYSFMMSFISFVLSSIELIGFTFFCMYAISNILSSSSVFTFNPLSIILMFGLTFVVSFLSSIIFSLKVNRIDPLNAIK